MFTARYEPIACIQQVTFVFKRLTEIVHSSETSVYIFHSIQHHFPEENYLCVFVVSILHINSYLVYPKSLMASQ